MSELYEQKCTGERRTLENWLPAYEQAADGINADLQPGQEPVDAEDFMYRDINDGLLIKVDDTV